MSALVFARDCETIAELIDWIEGQIPGSRVSFIGDEVVIMTGLEMSMGGYLHKIGAEE